MPYYPLASYSPAFTLGFWPLLQLLKGRQHSAWQEGRVQGIVNLQVTCNIIIWSLLNSKCSKASTLEKT